MHSLSYFLLTLYKLNFLNSFLNPMCLDKVTVETQKAIVEIMSGLSIVEAA